MGEEKKDSKDKKMLVYEQPRLVKLNGDEGEGDCCIGSSDNSCDTGCAAISCAGGDSPA